MTGIINGWDNAKITRSGAATKRWQLTLATKALDRGPARCPGSSVPAWVSAGRGDRG